MSAASVRHLRFSVWFATAAFLASPAGALTIANSSYDAAVNSADPVFLGADQSVSVNLSGVVEVYGYGVGSCSGSLLSDGTSILTAAHCVDGSSGVEVDFQGPSGFVKYIATSYTIDASYDGNGTDGGDLAVVQLGALAPAFATEYSLDMEPATYGVADVLAGYGFSGTGTSGYNTTDPGDNYGILRAGENEYDENGNTFSSTFDPPPNPLWSAGTLIGQFYESGNNSTNTMNCHSYNTSGCTFSPFTSVDEVDIAPGDSGGPTFQDVGGTMEIVGVHDFDACAGNCTASFGEEFGDTSVYANLNFIQSQIAPEPRTVSMMLGALLASLLLRTRRPESETAEISPRPGRTLRRNRRG